MSEGGPIGGGWSGGEEAAYSVDGVRCVCAMVVVQSRGVEE